MSKTANRFVTDDLRPKGLLFLLWPLLSFVDALMHFNLRSSRVIILAFFALYGFSYVFGNKSYDSYQYATEFIETSRLPFSEFWNVVSGASDPLSKKLDFVIPFLNFAVSRFTNNPNWLFAVYGLFFGFFYLKSVALLHDEYRRNKNVNALIFLIGFALVLTIFAINGMRFWTATWIFVYGTYHVVVKRTYRYLLVAAFSILVHFSFLPVVVLLSFYILLGDRIYLYLLLAGLSILFSSVVLDNFSVLSDFIGGPLAQRLDLYVGDAYREVLAARIHETRWFIKWRAPALFYFLLFAVFVTKVFFSIRFDAAQKHLLCFLLLLLAFSNVVMAIPSGGRFQILFDIVAIAYLCRFYCLSSQQRLTPIAAMAIVPLTLWFLVDLRTASEMLNVFLFIGNPLTIAIAGNELSVYDVLFR